MGSRRRDSFGGLSSLRILTEPWPKLAREKVCSLYATVALDREYPPGYPEIVMVRSRDLSLAFFVAAGVLVPWTLYLATTLPRHYPAHHYWLGWVGFDLALVAVLATTGLALARSSPAVSRYAAVATTMLVVDAWFDVLNAATSWDLLAAAVAAIAIELPLAYFCWQLSRRGSRPPGSNVAGGVAPEQPGS